MRSFFASLICLFFLNLANAQNVGINTAVPTATLDVNGSLRLRGGSPGVGKVLTSDALGHAVWQTFGGGGWSLTGNSGTNPALNFLGTTDNQPLIFKHNNILAGRFDYNLRNYFIGNQSGINSTAPFNVAIGDSALLQNTAGYSNIAIGSGALQRNLSYSNIVAIGDSALHMNGTFNDFTSVFNATRNTAVGSKALYTNSSGYGNTALGYEAGYANGLAWNNTLIGREAMRHGGGSGAEGNVAVGVFALDSNNNFHNTAIGAYSMRRNRLGINNTAVGHSALDNNISGSFNTAIGYSAGVSNATPISNATAVGAGAYVTQSNSMVLGTSSTNVGIGTTAPAHTLDLQTNSVFGGKVQLRLHETANDFARLRFTNTLTASNWEVAGYPNTTNSTARLNFFYSSLGDVLSLRGDGNATLAGTLTQLSDARLKKNIFPIQSSLTKLLRLKGYQYQWSDENKDQSMQLGVLAQEVESLFPELVKRDNKGMLSVNYSGLVPVLINAVREQQEMIDKLADRLATLEQKLNR